MVAKILISAKPAPGYVVIVVETNCVRMTRTPVLLGAQMATTEPDVRRPVVHIVQVLGDAIARVVNVTMAVRMDIMALDVSTSVSIHV